MIEAWLGKLESVFSWLLEASWQASVLAALVLLLQTLLRGRLNPRWHHALWLLVIARLVVPIQPESALSLFQFAPAPPPVVQKTFAEPIFQMSPLQVVETTAVAVPPVAYPVSIFTVFALIWLMGTVALLVLTWQVNRRFGRHVKAAPLVTDPRLLKLAETAQQELGIHRRLRIIESAQVQSPAIMGLFRPTLILPKEIRTRFSDAELRFIFLHELAHLKRGDLVLQWLVALLQIVHWFNPILWYAFRRMRADREPATDALVLSCTGELEKESYGQVLVKLLEHYHTRNSLPTLVGILEDKDQFKRRFSLISKFTRGAYGWSLLGVIIIAALAVAGLTKGNSVPTAADPALPYQIDLKPFYTRSFTDPDGADSTFAGYSGRKVIDGLPFNIDGEIMLYGNSYAERNGNAPMAVSGIKIDRKFDELHLIHCVHWREYPGCPVATLRLHYADGSNYDFPIRYEFQVGDWNRLLTENEEIIADPDTKIIWRGAGVAKGEGRLFKSIFHNPLPDKKVESMDIVSTGSFSSYALVAATVAQRDPGWAVTPPLPLYPSRQFDGALNVHVVDQKTGAPVAGAEVYPAMLIEGVSLVADSVLTASDGTALVKYPKVGEGDLRIEVGKAGYQNCDLNWQTGWPRGSVPSDVFCQLTPGDDSTLDARRVIGHWKKGSGWPPDVDITKIAYLYLGPEAPLSVPADADTPEKWQKWFNNWRTTDAGQTFTRTQKTPIRIQLQPDGTFSAESIAPGEYSLCGVFTDNGVAGHQFVFRSVVVPKNSGNDLNEPVDLGEIEVNAQDAPLGISTHAGYITSTNVTPNSAGKSTTDMVRIGVKVFQISEADYQAHRAEIDAAVQKGDAEPWVHLKSFDLLSSMQILTRSGQQSVMEAVRVLPYAVKYDNDPSGTRKPTEFAKKNLGVRIVQTPVIKAGKIAITGTFTASDLQDWTSTGYNTFQPVFNDSVLPFSVTLDSGQTQGLQTVGIPADSSDMEAVFLPNDPTHKPQRSKEPRHLLIFITASAWNEDGSPAHLVASPATTNNVVPQTQTYLHVSYIKTADTHAKPGGSTIGWDAAMKLLQFNKVVPLVESPIGPGINDVRFKTPSGLDCSVTVYPSTTQDQNIVVRTETSNWSMAFNLPSLHPNESFLITGGNANTPNTSNILIQFVNR